MLQCPFLTQPGILGELSMIQQNDEWNKGKEWFSDTMMVMMKAQHNYKQHTTLRTSFRNNIMDLWTAPIEVGESTS